MPVPRPRPFGRSATFCNATRRIAFCLVALGSDIGCSSSVPSAPALDFTVSGYVYGQHNGENGEPLIVDAVITARDADGHDISAVTDSKGFYTVRVRSGAVSIGATKAGYDASLSQEFTLSGNTVLNFRLLAKSPESVRSGSKRGLVHAARRDASWSAGLYTSCRVLFSDPALVAGSRGPTGWGPANRVRTDGKPIRTNRGV